jgi:hypothetical protein
MTRSPFLAIGRYIVLPAPTLDEALAWWLAVELRAEGREMPWRSA